MNTYAFCPNKATSRPTKTTAVATGEIQGITEPGPRIRIYHLLAIWILSSHSVFQFLNGDQVLGGIMEGMYVRVPGLHAVNV